MCTPQNDVFQRNGGQFFWLGRVPYPAHTPIRAFKSARYTGRESGIGVAASDLRACTCPPATHLTPPFPHKSGDGEANPYVSLHPSTDPSILSFLSRYMHAYLQFSIFHCFIHLLLMPRLPETANSGRAVCSSRFTCALQRCAGSAAQQSTLAKQSLAKPSSIVGALVVTWP